MATISPKAALGYIKLEDGQRVHTITANLTPGTQLGPQVAALTAAMEANPPPNATFAFGGDAEEQNAASAFLTKAFGIAIGLMFFILLVQFNRLWQTLLVLSAIVFSLGGVFWALALAGKPFIIVMGGIGIIALAGLVINTNILLIDTWNTLRAKGLTARDAALTAASTRLRPVLLTTLTTVLGLLPMAFGLSLDLIQGHWELGAPATQWWTELAITISGGLLMGTLITLFLTPVLLAQTWSWPWPFKRRPR
jgi:multidrug efflux pump